MFVALTGTGLSAAAGLNAFVPLLIVGAIARWTDIFVLPEALEWLSSWPALVGVSVLLVGETILDKIPGVDHVNDFVHTAVRPLVGAVIFSASTSARAVEESQVWADNPWLSYLAGGLVALTVHVSKAASRTAVNAATSGNGAPMLSAVEDVTAISMSFAALVLPWLVAVILIGMAVVAYRILTIRSRRRKRREKRRAARERASAGET